MVRTLVSTLAASALVFGAIGSSGGAPAALPPHAEPLADAGSCVGHRAEARSTGYGFRHVVVIDNRCQKAVVCDVSTDVNPQVQKVSVPAGETREVVTFLESPASEFTPRVSCQ